MDKRGRIIAIDGPDGCGKTTQIDRLVEHLKSQGKNVYRTRASGGTPIGEELRKVSLSNIEREPAVDLYISLAMHSALGNDLAEKRQQYDALIIDRSPLAILAYNAFGSQLNDISHAYNACERMLRLWQIEDLLAFSINEQELEKRQQQRLVDQPDQTTDFFEVQDSEYKLRVHRGYAKAYEFAKDLPGLHTKFHVIDANGTIENVESAVFQALRV